MSNLERYAWSFAFNLPCALAAGISLTLGYHSRGDFGVSLAAVIIGAISGRLWMGVIPDEPEGQTYE